MMFKPWNVYNEALKFQVSKGKKMKLEMTPIDAFYFVLPVVYTPRKLTAGYPK